MVKRFDFTVSFTNTGDEIHSVKEVEDGSYVLYSDYKKLEDELEKVRQDSGNPSPTKRLTI